MKNKRFLTIFICIFLVIVLVFGATLGIIVGVKNANAAAKYADTTVSEGATVCLASRYKAIYIRTLNASGITAADSAAFWRREGGNGKTYGELLCDGFEDYLASLLVACSLYERNGSYTASDRNTVKRAVQTVLDEEADGSVSRFNELTEKYGFDYKDFSEAAELLYKAERAQAIYYGAGGEKLASYPDECMEYLSKYSHVSLLFIRTEHKLYTNDAGVTDLIPLTSEEKAEKQAAITAVREAIQNLQTGADGQMNPQMFSQYLANSDGDPAYYEKGYYFYNKAEATVEFAGEFVDIVARSYEMSVGDYSEVTVNTERFVGVCFIYKSDVVRGAYTDRTNVFLSDFYSDASDYLYSAVLDELIGDVHFTEKYESIDIISIPKNISFYIKAW